MPGNYALSDTEIIDFYHCVDRCVLEWRIQDVNGPENTIDSVNIPIKIVRTGDTVNLEMLLTYLGDVYEFDFPIKPTVIRESKVIIFSGESSGVRIKGRQSFGGENFRHMEKFGSISFRGVVGNFSEAGLCADRIYSKPIVKIKILLVADGPFTLDKEYFGLSTALENIEKAKINYPWLDIGVDFVNKSYESEELCRIEKSGGIRKFSQSRKLTWGLLQKYDEVWFLGYEQSSKVIPGVENKPAKGIGPNFSNLSESELKSLQKFMGKEKKGGVFACGDHSVFGSALCADIPRVRWMQKWIQEAPPFAMYVATPGNFVFYPNNTLQPRKDNPQTPVDESRVRTSREQMDEIPKPIDVRHFLEYQHQSPINDRDTRRALLEERRLLPHPVMSFPSAPYGPPGVIDKLPDHMHEGEVVRFEDVKDDIICDPEKRNWEFPFWPSKEKTIWPWEIIANAVSLNEFFNGVSIRPIRTFGTVGAYEGFKVDLGRIVVDSTFHHWIDLNLIGNRVFEKETDSRFRFIGFDPKLAPDAYQKIKAYHQNVALWLAPPSKQGLIAMAALWQSLSIPELIEVLDFRIFNSPGDHARDIGLLGKQAINFLSSFIGEAHVRTWWFSIASYFWKPDYGIPAKNGTESEIIKEICSLLNTDVLVNYDVFMPVLDSFMIGGILNQFYSVLKKKEISEPGQLIPGAYLGLLLGLQSFKEYARIAIGNLATIGSFPSASPFENLQKKDPNVVELF